MAEGIEMLYPKCLTVYLAWTGLGIALLIISIIKPDLPMVFAVWPISSL